MTVTCKYTCALCGLYRQEAEVPARGEEDVVDWVQNVAVPVLMADHESRSPNCHPHEFKEVLLPIGGDKVGGVTVQ